MRNKLKSKTIACITVFVTVMAVVPSAVANEEWTVETQDNSAGISHKQETLVFPDPVPEAAPAPVVQGGEASVGEGSVIRLWRNSRRLWMTACRKQG